MRGERQRRDSMGRRTAQYNVEHPAGNTSRGPGSATRQGSWRWNTRLYLGFPCCGVIAKSKRASQDAHTPYYNHHRLQSGFQRPTGSEGLCDVSVPPPPFNHLHDRAIRTDLHSPPRPARRATTCYAGCRKQSPGKHRTVIIPLPGIFFLLHLSLHIVSLIPLSLFCSPLPSRPF